MVNVRPVIQTQTEIETELSLRILVRSTAHIHTIKAKLRKSFEYPGFRGLVSVLLLLPMLVMK